MSNIIIPQNFKSAERPFADLYNNKKQLIQAINEFAACVEKSFADDEKNMGRGFVEKTRNQTEEKRRVDILGKWYRTLRKECGYSHDRAIGSLYTALRAELNGDEYNPPKAVGLYSAGLSATY